MFVFSLLLMGETIYFSLQTVARTLCEIMHLSRVKLSHGTLLHLNKI